MMLRAVQRENGVTDAVPNGHFDPEKDDRHHDILTEFTLVDFDATPRFLALNPHIRTGYRVYFSLGLCSHSIVRLHNETGNIWSHLLAVAAIFGLFVSAFAQGVFSGSLAESAFILLYMVAGVLCFGFSTIYHTYHCHSQQACRRLSQLDYIGIGFLMCSAFFPSLLYGFWCDGDLHLYYMSLIALMSVVVLCILIVPSLANSLNYYLRLGLFFTIAMFAFIPLLHWVAIRGLDSPELVHGYRILAMFGIFGFATVVYVFHIPERWWPGVFDTWGHSHQWWHLLVVATFLWQYQSILVLQQYRRNVPCLPLG